MIDKCLAFTGNLEDVLLQREGLKYIFVLFNMLLFS